MQIGKLRHRVIIQEKVLTPDGQGGNSQSWREFATVWASVESQGGREFQTARQTRATLTDQVVMRYRAGITSDMRIVHRGRILAIARPPMDPDGRERELLLFCEEISGETP
jgi:SPP1 family predicted phage head-tail adaptor